MIVDIERLQSWVLRMIKKERERYITTAIVHDVNSEGVSVKDTIDGTPSIKRRKRIDGLTVNSGDHVLIMNGVVVGKII